MRTYTTQAALPTTRRVELVGKKEFAAAALDPGHETYVVYVGSVSSVASPSSSPLDIHPTRRPQIAGLIAEEAPIKVPIEYANFADVFSPDLTSKLPEHTGINDQAIKLVDSQRPLYGPIYKIRAGRTIQVTRRSSHLFRPEVGRIPSVVRLETQ